jgi:hypothetical protein
MDLIPNLIFCYHTIVASEDLLIEAAKRSEGPLEDYFREHLSEEKDHAQWLAEDLVSVGIRVWETQIPIEVVEMVGSVYYMVFHADPAALLGYMQVLEREDWPMLPQWEKDYPASLLRTVKHHAEHDPGHARKLRDIIETLEPERRALVEQTRQRTLHYLQRAFTCQ